MVVRISDKPFAQWDEVNFGDHLGPAWFEINGPDLKVDVPITMSLFKFLEAAEKMAKGNRFMYGSVYATKLDGSARERGQWHYDMGEYTHEGEQRFVSTWRSDNYQIGNEFRLPDGSIVMAPNMYVTQFHAGSDLHRSPSRPESNATGVFMSASFYNVLEPANLDCPRLEPLRNRGFFGEYAKHHKPVVRERY